MFRRLLCKLGLAAACLGGLLVFAQPASAQSWRAAYWGVGRGYGGWNSPYWGYGRWGYYGPSYGWPGYYGYGWSYPYGYAGWSGYWPNAYYTYGYWPSYASYDGRYYPNWYGTNYAPYTSYGVVTGSSYSMASSEAAQNGRYYGATTTNPDSVLITVKVPPDAEIWFDSHKTAQTGIDRQFVTPPLDPARNFTYNVHARWMEGNRPVDQTRKVAVHAGEELTVDFTAPPPETNEAASRSEEIRAPQMKTHEGRVVRFSNHELVMKGADGREHSHTLVKDAKVTIDGQPARAEDLKPDMKIEVTTPEGDAKTALRIEAKSSK